MAPLPNIQEGWECVIQTLKDNFNLSKAIAATPDSRIDHLNGREFRIRSATKPHRYWSFVDGQTLRFMDQTYNGFASYQCPTRFIIRRLNELSYEPDRKDEDILIGEDDVEISVAPECAGGPSLKLWMNPIQPMGDVFNITATRNDGAVANSNTNMANLDNLYIFKFSWFENGFFMKNFSTESYPPLYAAPGRGERWELVE